MSDTNPCNQSPKFPQPIAENDPTNDVLNYSKRYFLHEFVELGTNVCEGITSCLEVIEKADSTTTDNTAKATTKFCAEHAGPLQTFALTSTRLLGEFAVKHIAWISDDAPSPQQVMDADQNKRPH